MGLDQADFNGRWLKVHESVNKANDDNKRKRDTNEKVEKPAGCNTLFVGNIPFSMTEDKMNKIFSKFGEVVRVSLPIFPDTEKMRGFGHVEFTNEEDCEKCFNEIDRNIDGREVRMD